MSCPLSQHYSPFLSGVLNSVVWGNGRDFYLLLQNGNKQKAYLTPIILSDILCSHQNKITKLIEKESEKPKQHAKVKFDTHTVLEKVIFSIGLTDHS